MKIIDVSNPSRIKKAPTDTVEIFSSGTYEKDGFKIKKVELRLYAQNKENEVESDCLITSLVETDKGTIEMTYIENQKRDSLRDVAKFLSSNLGPSGIILRSIITLSEALKNQKMND